MQSSCKVIKSTVIDDKKVISPPVVKALFSKSSEVEKKNFNLDEICENIIQEANELKNKIIKDAESQSHFIINNAKDEIETILNTSKAEGFQQGFQEGYQRGYEQGFTEAEGEAKEITENANAYLISCHEASATYIREKQKDIVKLSIEIARKVLNTELTINTDAIFKIAERILSRTIDKRQVVLKVNPQDFTIIKNRRDELSIFVEDSNNLMIVADASIDQGGMRAETPSGLIEGDIETQLDIVLKKLLEG